MKSKIERDLKAEGRGWLSMIGIILLFPTLFFFCVFFPIFMGWTQRW